MSQAPARRERRPGRPPSEPEGPTPSPPFSRGEEEAHSEGSGGPWLGPTEAGMVTLARGCHPAQA